MSGWRRHLVDILWLGLFWTVLWGVTGAMLSIIVGFVDPLSIDPGEGPLELARVLGGVGVRTGLVFGLLVAAVERHRGVADLPVLRAVFWGAIAGLAVPLLFTGVNDRVIFNAVPLGAATAAVSVALARVVRRRRATAGPVAQPGASRQAEPKES